MHSEQTEAQPVTKDILIHQIRFLQHGNPTHRITRDHYRQISHYQDKCWQQFWPTFGAFADEAKDLVTTISGGIDTAEVTELEDDTLRITIPKTHIHTLEQLKAYKNIDDNEWEVSSWKCSVWEVSDDGREPRHSISATFTKRKQLIAIQDEIASLKEDAKNYAPIPCPVIHTLRNTENALELLIPDLHAGKRAWGAETQHGDYDTRIAEQTYIRAVNTILNRAQGYEFDEIMLGVGNDLLNSDNFNSTTTKGTYVDSDNRYPKTYKVVRRMLVDTIERLRQIAPVKVKLIPGNHDTLTNFTLGDSLECWFHNYTDVEIDNAPTPYKFYSWGDVFLMLTHGDKGKIDDYPMWMATERPKEFGNSKFREIHMGHTHKTKVDEKFGIRTRTFSALCKPDAWHSENAFVGNLRCAEGIVWNKTAGRIAEFIHTEID